MTTEHILIKGVKHVDDLTQEQARSTVYHNRDEKNFTQEFCGLIIQDGQIKPKVTVRLYHTASTVKACVWTFPRAGSTALYHNGSARMSRNYYGEANSVIVMRAMTAAGVEFISTEKDVAPYSDWVIEDMIKAVMINLYGSDIEGYVHKAHG